MPLKRWPRLSSRPLADYRIMKVRSDVFRSPRTGKEHEFFVFEAPAWVNVVPLTDAGEVVLVRQHRFGIDDFTLEVPGGMVDPGETPATAAGRELLEETGYRAREIVPLGQIHPNPALQPNVTWSFLARGCEYVGAPHLETTEDIEVVTVPLERIDDMLRSGEISHALVAVAFLHLKLKQP